MNDYSILEADIRFPESATRYLITEDTHCGFEIVAICDDEIEAQSLIDTLQSPKEG